MTHPDGWAIEYSDAEYEPVCCTHCGQEMEWEDCGECEDGYSHHDCGEDTCCCADPEPNVKCDQCGGDGGWWFCMNRDCPGKRDDDGR